MMRIVKLRHWHFPKILVQLYCSSQYGNMIKEHQQLGLNDQTACYDWYTNPTFDVTHTPRINNNNNSKSRHVTLLLPKLDIYLVCLTMPTTFRPWFPNLHSSSVHKRARRRRSPPPSSLPLTLLPNTPGTQNETILRCNWQPRTRKKERKKKKEISNKESR